MVSYSPIASFMMLFLSSGSKHVKCLQMRHLATRRYNSAILRADRGSLCLVLPHKFRHNGNHHSLSSTIFHQRETHVPMRQYLFPRVTLRLHSATSSSSDESTPFNNGINADTSTNTPPTSASAALEKYLSQLVQRGVLSVDETQSISGALFNPNWEQIFPSEDKIDDGILRMIPESVDVYISQKMRRIETGREAIEKPGSYVRSVVKKQMELKGIEIPQNTQQLENSQNHPGINDANNDGVPTNLESILQANNVEQMDLNENCMLALIRCPIQTAKYALETYTKQQKRREMSGMDKISSPSSYIMAVLRNAPEQPNENVEKTSTTPAMNVQNASSVDTNISQTLEKESNNAIERKPDQSKKKSREISAVAGATPLDNKIDEPDALQSVTNQIQNSRPSVEMTQTTHNNHIEDVMMIEDQERMPEPTAHNGDSKSFQSSLHENKVDGEAMQMNFANATDVSDNGESSNKVTMEYVDKCLSCLARLETPIIKISGVGPKTEQAFHKIGIFTLRDLLWHFPRSFIDRSKLHKNVNEVPDGEIGTFRVMVQADRIRHNTVPCTDESGNNFDVTFFFGRSRQGGIMASTASANLCKNGTSLMIVSGKVTHSDKGAGIFNPDIVVPVDEADSVLGIEPVYGLAASLTKKKIVSAVEESLNVAQELLRCMPESLPDNILEELSWPKLADALVLAHKPKSLSGTMLDSPARQRLAFEELCMQQAQLALARWRLKHVGVASGSTEVMYPTWQSSSLVLEAISKLPFELRESQKTCLEEMWSDAIGGENGRMIRLLQGDVGSGKTVLAYLLGLGCIDSRQGGGRVVALLAPTQLLAIQHAQSISEFADALNNMEHHPGIKTVRVELLTGSVTGSTRDELLNRLETVSDDDAVFLIGTHALVTPDIVERLKNLPSVSSAKGKGVALSIVDEEHRFGVRQRQSLAMCAAHTLYMSATPIPRTISLRGTTGLIDFSLLESEPRAVETTIVSSDMIERVATTLGTKINAGSKCFWVLPRIGDDEKAETEESISQQSNVLDRHKMLSDAFGKDRVGFVHGRMKVKEREAMLARFADPSSTVDVLVSTTVIEVGIDIPNVNLLVVEDADRFGLSQLHQLRGRIGRAGSLSGLKCHCLLLTTAANGSHGEDSTSLTRLEVLRETMSGNEIANADFMLRGPGEFLGFLQSGIKTGFTVNPDNHWDMLESASVLGRGFFTTDGTISRTSSGTNESPSTANDLLLHNLRQKKIMVHYDQTHASLPRGFALRVIMALFAHWRHGPANDNNALDAFVDLHQLSASKNEEDNLVNDKILSLLQSFCDGSNIGYEILPRDDALSHSNNNVMVDSVLPVKPHVAVLSSNRPVKNRVNLMEEDVVFIVLDVETTGLDERTSHVIQLAAKVLGSNNEEDLFSEYMLPPIEKIPAKIEELTGITDEFLRKGGFDSALGVERNGPASGFREVFTAFQTFCESKAQGRPVCLVAHNAKFDIRMIESELRRWRIADGQDRDEKNTAPVLGEVFDMSLDTLRLFKDPQFWRSTFENPNSPQRPSSFGLADLHRHVINESVENSHNAVGDIIALERLLLSESFNGWKRVATDIQTPIIDPLIAVKKYRQ